MKQRYSDFIVNEIDINNRVIQLQSTSIGELDDTADSRKTTEIENSELPSELIPVDKLVIASILYYPEQFMGLKKVESFRSSHINNEGYSDFFQV